MSWRIREALPAPEGIFPFPELRKGFRRLLPRMAFPAIHFLPGVADFFRMLERKATGVQRGRLRIGALVEDGVAAITVFGNHLPGRADVLAVVAAEAPDVGHVADVVGIGLPVDV